MKNIIIRNYNLVYSLYSGLDTDEDLIYMCILDLDVYLIIIRSWLMLLWRLRHPKPCRQQAGDPGTDGIVLVQV